MRCLVRLCAGDRGRSVRALGGPVIGGRGGFSSRPPRVRALPGLYCLSGLRLSIGRDRHWGTRRFFAPAPWVSRAHAGCRPLAVPALFRPRPPLDYRNGRLAPGPWLCLSTPSSKKMLLAPETPVATWQRHARASARPHVTELNVVPRAPSPRPDIAVPLLQPNRRCLLFKADKPPLLQSQRSPRVLVWAEVVLALLTPHPLSHR